MTSVRPRVRPSAGCCVGFASSWPGTVRSIGGGIGGPAVLGAGARSSTCRARPAPPTAAPACLEGWALVRRVAAAAGVAGALLAGAPFGNAAARNAQTAAQLHRNRQTQVVASATSDVEAAAVTLGIVTVGGLAMRAVFNARKDPDEERRIAQEQSNKLALEEEERGRRMARKKMEQVDGDTLDDDELLSAFQSRIERLNVPDSDADAEADDPTNDLDKFMRHTPIPDRGSTGSMLLDKPDEENDSSPEDPEADGLGNPDPEKLELLKRMWNLNSPDEKDVTK